MMGYKDVLSDMPDSEYEEVIGLLNDTLADDAEAVRQWQDERTIDYSHNRKEPKQ